MRNKFKLVSDYSILIVVWNLDNTHQIIPVFIKHEMLTFKKVKQDSESTHVIMERLHKLIKSEWPKAKHVSKGN